jgi:hypothetical protein
VYGKLGTHSNNPAQRRSVELAELFAINANQELHAKDKFTIAPSRLSSCVPCVNLIFVSTRATIFRHVILDDSSCFPRTLQKVDHFEYHIMAFSWDLQLFFSFFARQSEA